MTLIQPLPKYGLH